MSSFLRELQQVYGEGYIGDITNFPSMASGQKAAARSSISYFGLPGNQPGQGYPSSPPVTIPDEAEDEAVISKSLLKKRVNELLQHAEDTGMTYAMEALYDVLDFIKRH